MNLEQENSDGNIEKELLNLDIMGMSPREALEWLMNTQQKLKGL